MNAKDKIDENIGKQFNYLTIIKRVNDYITPKGQHMKRYLCRCTCGNEKEFVFNNIKRGNVKSCGCLHNNLISESKRKYNSYDLSGEYGIGWAANTNKEFYFDLEDYDLIKDYHWRENKDGYIISNTFGHHISIHQLILPTDLYVDHIITENKFDNRKSNLREVSFIDNMCNQKIQTNNTSGIKGVYYDKKEDRWAASLTRNKKRITKYFITKEDAIKFRYYLEEKYQKDYSYNESQKLKKEDK